MPNFLTTHVATFRQPSNTVPKTYSDYASVDVCFSQASSSEVNWARFSGVSYSWKIVAVLPDTLRQLITEDWQIVVDGEEYSVKNIKHVITPFGYDHTTVFVS